MSTLQSWWDTTLFMTEGDSASGSITKSRDVNTQAVFSLRGKPLNSYGLTKKVVYENEEFNLIQAALDIEDEMDNLRYNRIVIATDADVDGMHIRLLLLTFFLQFFPDLIKNGHRKIGFLTTEDYLSVGKLRTDGYYQALTDNHITIDESLVLKIHTQSNYYTEIEKLVKSQTFDALVTVNEAFAATGIKVLHDYGIKTPEKVSVISLSDGIISRHMIPSITAVNQNGFLMGQKSATLLINRIEGKSDADFQTEIIPTNIIFRDSVLNKG